jgi:hypothetical protein
VFAVLENVPAPHLVQCVELLHEPGGHEHCRLLPNPDAEKLGRQAQDAGDRAAVPSVDIE